MITSVPPAVLRQAVEIHMLWDQLKNDGLPLRTLQLGADYDSNLRVLSRLLERSIKRIWPGAQSRTHNYMPYVTLELTALSRADLSAEVVTSLLGSAAATPHVSITWSERVITVSVGHRTMFGEDQEVDMPRTWTALRDALLRIRAADDFVVGGTHTAAD